MDPSVLWGGCVTVGHGSQTSLIIPSFLQHLCLFSNPMSVCIWGGG